MIKINTVFSFPTTILEHMNYSTLREAYSVDSFEKDRKKTKKTKSARYEEEFEDAPQKPDTDVKQPDIQQPISKENKVQKQIPKNLTNIQPHYDEELEKYLNINDFQNANDYFPQNYENSHYSTNYSSPDNSHGTYDATRGNMGKYEPRQLYYRSKAQNNEPVQQLQTHRPVLHYQPPPTHEPHPPMQQSQHQVERTRETFKPIQRPQLYQEQQDIGKNEYVDKKDTFYKNLVNIGLFIFIGILIIFLCEQITEIAINIGMKRTLTILEPYIQKHKSVKFSTLKDANKM